MSRTFVADRGDDRRRVDHVVMRRLAEQAVSRTAVQRWVGEGRVEVNGLPATRPAQRVLAGQRVDVDLPDSLVEASVLVPEDLPVSIIYEDAFLLAVNKPAGLVVHPSYRQYSGTLLNGLSHYARNWPSGRPSLVHRLDKLTSGILLVAKSPEAHAQLARSLTAPDARKEYLALCYGRMSRGHRRLRYPLLRDPFDRRRVIVADSGMEAATDVTRVATTRGEARGLTLVSCRLLTGRTHQIRVHLRADRLPLVGDPVYGEPGWRHIPDPSLAQALRAFPRQALHAWTLTFRHPCSGDLLTLRAPLADDMLDLLRRGRLDLRLPAEANSQSGVFPRASASISSSQVT